MGNLLDGKALADARRKALRERLRQLPGKPGLAVVLVGNDPASKLYVSLKERASVEVGITFEKHAFDERADERLILGRIGELNARSGIHGIVVQLPLPRSLNEDRIVARVDPRKDVDGFHPANVTAFLGGAAKRTPSLIRAIAALLEASGATVQDKKITVVARESVFTRCLRFFLETRGGHVLVHPPLNAFSAATETADLLIVAAGKPKLIKEYMVKPGAVVIDVGINHLPDGTIVGDVDTEAVKRKAAWITPVPGGVGPVTVVSLLENVVEAYEQVQSVKGKG